MSLSVSTAWDETAAFARREARFLFPTAFLLISLPAAILQALAPVTAPGRLPEAGLWLLFVPAVLVASLFGALAISRLALSPAVRGRAAFAAALRGFLPLFGAVLLIWFAAAVLAMAALLLAVMIAAPVFSALPLLGLLAAAVFCWVRMLLLTPVAAVEPVGPRELIMRSWALTAGNFWRLSAFLLVAAIVSLVALTAAGAVGGIAIRLAAGQPRPGTLAMVLVLLLSALLQAAISGLFTAFLARLYAQLAGDDTAG